MAQTDPVSPWHEGELVIQRRAGVTDQMDAVGRRVVRDHLIDQHRTFYPQLPFIVVGAVDPAGNAWATIVTGEPGFLQSPNPHTLRILAPRCEADPAEAGLGDKDSVGLLGIELHTRRRNRLNGTIRRIDAAGFEVAVVESYGNCPQYIQLRDFSFVRDPADRSGDAPYCLGELDEHARRMIADADTFFIASYITREDSHRMVDVSHRGGKSGFVRIGDDGVLTFPDFAGNLFFNTLGNIFVNPACGLVFVDFESGDMLHLAGEGEVILDSPEIAAFQGAERLVRFRPRRIVMRPGALPLRWMSQPDGSSPNSALTGTWADASARLRAPEISTNWRKFRVGRVDEESSIIRSLILEPIDSAGLVPHEAGQHLIVRLRLPNADTPATRTYTLSCAPSDGTYRISVKRQGTVSSCLHAFKVGDVIEARGPAGDFTIDAQEKRPVVLLAAGVGVTPMLAMLRHLVYEGKRTRHIRPTWLFYAAHSKGERAFDEEIAALRAAGGGLVRVVRTLGDVSGADRSDYESAGRIDMELLRRTLRFDDYDFYICGPAPFMQELYEGLRGLNVIDARIHAEAFGPASLTRKADTGTLAGTLGEPAKEPVMVTFAVSRKLGSWKPGSGSLLDLAETLGLSPAFSCRMGTCGSCRVRILAGAVAYEKAPAAKLAYGEALICCAVPAVPSKIDDALQIEL